jgi:polar amino acid transport system substrate-binding protein
MRLALGALLFVGMASAAADAPLRFVVPDSWTMPMVQLERGRPTQGILYDVMLSLATQVGVPAEFHVMPRARVQSAMEHGEIDVRCYAAQSWLPNQSGDYIWSIPLWVQPDVLLSRPDPLTSADPAHLPRQSIGTVRGYIYPTLQPLFDADKLEREDARNQEQVLEKLLAGRYRYAVSNQWTMD